MGAIGGADLHLGSASAAAGTLGTALWKGAANQLRRSGIYIVDSSYPVPLRRMSLLRSWLAASRRQFPRFAVSRRFFATRLLLFSGCGRSALDYGALPLGRDRKFYRFHSRLRSPYTQESDTSPSTMQFSRSVPSRTNRSFSSTRLDAVLRVSVSA
jgi:hypothetical protein